MVFKKIFPAFTFLLISLLLLQVISCSSQIEEDGVQEPASIDVYNLIIEIDGQGVTRPVHGIHECEKGAEITVTVTPAAGWTFDHWGGDATGDSPTTSITMNEDKFVKAYFVPVLNIFSLSITIDGQGTTEPLPGTYTYNEGSEVEVTVSPSPGWEFAHWQGDASGNSLTTTVMMNKTKDIIAYFVPATFSLQIEVDGEGTTNPVPGTYSYDMDIEVMITASPATGYEFARWEGDVTGSSPSINVTMDSDKSVAAVFRPIGNIQITYIFYDGQVPSVESDEYVEIKNSGNSAQDISGWVLIDGSDGHPSFTFPPYVLEPGETIRVYTNEIHPEWGGFSFEYGRAIWDNNYPDTAVLLSSSGQEVSSKSYQ